MAKPYDDQGAAVRAGLADDLESDVERAVMSCARQGGDTDADLLGSVGEEFSSNQTIFALLGCIQGKLQQVAPGIVLIHILSLEAKTLGEGRYIELVQWVLRKIFEHRMQIRSVALWNR